MKYATEAEVDEIKQGKDEFNPTVKESELLQNEEEIISDADVERTHTFPECKPLPSESTSSFGAVSGTKPTYIDRNDYRRYYAYIENGLRTAVSPEPYIKLLEQCVRDYNEHPSSLVPPPFFLVTFQNF